jgi:hypothetical protein
MTAATKAFRPTYSPISGLTEVSLMAYRSPAPAASALLIMNVSAMTRSVAMPISCATRWSKDTARIAWPKRVRYTRNCSPTISPMAMRKLSTCQFHSTTSGSSGSPSVSHMAGLMT